MNKKGHKGRFWMLLLVIIGVAAQYMNNADGNTARNQSGSSAGFGIQYSGAFLPASGMQANEQADSLQEFIRIFGKHAEAVEESFSIKVSDQVSRELDRTVSYTSAGQKISLLSEIANNFGIVTVSIVSQGNVVRYIPEYYEGTRILYAHQHQQTGELSERERQTLQAALIIANQCRGTDLEREKQIHDTLCDRIRYYTDDTPHDENDCAVGALLSGRADCDGYSDAFYLCGNLAGLNVRHMTGRAVKSGLGNNRHHMWNLVQIFGSWVITDVTWDDSDNGTSYMFYNIGSNEAALSYTWEEAAVPVSIQAATVDLRRNPELMRTSVSTWNQIYSVLKKGAESRQDRICITGPAALNFSGNSTSLYNLVNSVGVKSFDWTFSPAGVELFRIQYYENFAICETQNDVKRLLSASKYSRRPVVICCASDTLYRNLTQNHAKPVYDMLSTAGYGNSRVSIGAETRSIFIN